METVTHREWQRDKMTRRTRQGEAVMRTSNRLGKAKRTAGNKVHRRKTQNTNAKTKQEATAEGGEAMGQGHR